MELRKLNHASNLNEEKQIWGDYHEQVIAARNARRLKTLQEIEEELVWAEYYRQLAIAIAIGNGEKVLPFETQNSPYPPLPNDFWVPYNGGETNSGEKKSRATNKTKEERKKRHKNSAAKRCSSTTLLP
ncbi:MAG TPA: hypothetical protein VKK79_01350 [Candidatus Lokiarchaeia archaeon]|nr:hypothetical protein [Candidatus Lokiarchaeia archaeon]